MKNILRKKSFSPYMIAVYLLLGLGLIIVFAPFMYMITVALSENAYHMPYPPRLLPDEFQWENFVSIWNEENFGRYFLNSFFVAGVTTLLSLFVSSSCAYGFAKFEFKGKEIIFKILLFTMMVPGVLNIVPNYTVISNLGLVDTYSGLIILYVGTGIAGNTFFLRSFFESIPHELEESVIIDGGNRWTIFKKIILPLSTPCIGTFSIFSFSNIWDEFFSALTLLKSPEKRTLPIAIKLFEGQHVSNFSMIFAASLIAIVPIILIYVLFSKYLIKGGISEGAIKG